MMSKNPIVIAVDFDGTCVAHEFPKVGKDIGAVPVLKKLVANGHKLVLFTMRSNCDESNGHSDEYPNVTTGPFLDEAVNWFKENDIPLYGIQVNPTQTSWTSSPKVYANLYVDDAALGCPLRIDPAHARPYVDWKVVEMYLQNEGLI